MRWHGACSFNGFYRAGVVDRSSEIYNIQDLLHLEEDSLICRINLIPGSYLRHAVDSIFLLSFFSLPISILLKRRCS